MSGIIGNMTRAEKARERGRRWHMANREKHCAAMRKAWAARSEQDRERRRASVRVWRANNLETVRERARLWHREHPEGGRDWMREHRASHPEQAEKEREYTRKWYAANGWKYRELNQERAREWYAANRQRAQEAMRALRNKHPERKRVYEAHRRTRKRGNGGSHTAAEWTSLCWSSGWRCLYCGVGPLNERTVVQEHRVPLVRGGSNDIENIAVSCARCNSRKGAKTAEEFTAQLARSSS